MLFNSYCMGQICLKVVCLLSELLLLLPNSLKSVFTWNCLLGTVICWKTAILS